MLTFRGPLANALVAFRWASQGRVIFAVCAFIAGLLTPMLIDPSYAQRVMTFLMSGSHGQAVALLLVSAGVLIAIFFSLWAAAPAAVPVRASANRAEYVTREVRNELTTILSQLREHMDLQNRYDSALEKFQTELGSLAEADQVWNIVKLLMDENKKMRADATELKTSLQDSKSRIEALRCDLASAQKEALLDPLTAVGNRRRFEGDLEKAVARSHKEKTPLCLVIADLDNFKVLNDTFGHVIGDDVLRQFADLLVRNVKGRDRVARFGGEEFALLLPLTPMGNAYHLTEQIRQQLEDATLVEHTGHDVAPAVTASFGIAQLRDSDTGKDLLMRADAKLYEAKQLGRNRIAVEHSLVA